jgi:hypothetical protein
MHLIKFHKRKLKNSEPLPILINELLLKIALIYQELVNKRFQLLEYFDFYLIRLKKILTNISNNLLSFFDRKYKPFHKKNNLMILTGTSIQNNFDNFQTLLTRFH